MANKSVAYKILEQHLVSGKLVPGEEIAIRIDQTLTQDATGTMAYLQFETLGLPKVKTKLSVSYIDHNTLQVGFENADDHRYLMSVAKKYGIYFSRAGNGICHQVHLERFSRPGQTLLGSDSHTPTASGVGMIAMGAGGLDVAVAMGGAPFYLTCPHIVQVELKGKLPPWVSAKDIILELLRRLSVKGGVRKIFEYTGPGVKQLSVPERATITNMGTELGATSSVFPSDEVTRSFFAAQKRLKDWKPLEADPDAHYDETIEINFDELEPLVAQPHQPDNVASVKDLEGMPVNQVIIGSCTNSSYTDLVSAAKMLRGKHIPPSVSFAVAPGSRQVLLHLAKEGYLDLFIRAGARILENVCGPCIGMGQAPPSGGITLRTFNRNFKARSGTKDALIYLSGVETAVAAALKGKLTDPRKLGRPPTVTLPKNFIVDDSMIIPPLAARQRARVEIVRGPNIKPVSMRGPLPDHYEGEVLLKVGDNISTDDIMPAGAKILPLRSNIPAISEYVFSGVDPEFSQRAQEKQGGFIIGGENYGQGSSREHAALAPMHLGVRAVLAKSFARIHQANLANFGILPLEFENPRDLETLKQGDRLVFKNLREQVSKREDVDVYNETQGKRYRTRLTLTPRQRELVLAGGLLNYVKEQA